MLKNLQLLLKDDQKITHLFNHILVIYSFFLPLSRDARKSTFFVLIILFLIHPNIKNNILKALKNSVIQSILLLFCLFLVSLPMVEDYSMAKHFLERYKVFLYPLILFPLIKYNYLPKFFTAFFLGMIINELISYGIFFELLPNTLSYDNSSFDPVPFTYSHLAYGYVLSITIGLLLYQIFKNKQIDIYKRALMILFFSTATINMFIIGGRIGYVLYAISIIITTLFVFRNNFLKSIIAIILYISIIFTLAYSFSPIVKMKVIQTQETIEKLYNENNYNSSFGKRLSMWTVAIDVYKENPIFGIGIGQHIKKVNDVAKNKYPEFSGSIKSMGKNVHNGYVDVILQLGIIGLVSFLFIFYRMYTYKQKDPFLKLTLLLLIFSTLIYSIISMPFRNIPIIVFISLLSFSLVKEEVDNTYIYKTKFKDYLYYLLGAIILVIIGIYT